MEFHEKTCTPCRGGVPPLTGEEVTSLKRNVPDWEVRDGDTTEQRRTREFLRRRLDGACC